MHEVIKEKWERQRPITAKEIVGLLMLFGIGLSLAIDTGRCLGVDSTTMSSLCAMVAVGFPRALGNPMLTDSAISWRLVLRCLPWDLVLVRLGGSALQLVAKHSGASSWLLETALADSIRPELRPEWCLIALLATTAVGAELDTTDIDPKLVRSLVFLAEKFERHPLYFALPVVMQSRYVLLMPYTRPSLIFLRLHGNVRSAQLLMIGILIKVATFVCSVIAANTVLLV